jgi:hypothetical protein
LHGSWTWSFATTHAASEPTTRQAPHQFDLANQPVER